MPTFIAALAALLIAATPSAAAARATEIPYVRNQLHVIVTDHRETVRHGDVLEYLVTVRNPEDRPVTVDVTVEIPQLVYVTAAPGAVLTRGRLLWRRVTLYSTQERAFSFRAFGDPRLPDHFPVQVVVKAGGAVASDRTISRRALPPPIAPGRTASPCPGSWRVPSRCPLVLGLRAH